MNIDLLSLFIAIIVSLIAAFSSYFTKNYIEKHREKKLYLRNSKGEIREIYIAAGSTDLDIKEALTDSINYEKLVEEYIRTVKPGEAILVKGFSGEGFDFVVEANHRKLLFEVKATTHPVEISDIKNLIKAASQGSDDIVIISKSGFTDKVYDYVKTKLISGKARISLISGVDHEKMKADLIETLVEKNV